MAPLNDYQGRTVRLSAERLAHILDHPEMIDILPMMERTLVEPELVVRSRTDDKGLPPYPVNAGSAPDRLCFAGCRPASREAESLS